MTAIHKKRLTIIAILTACAMFVIGLFFVFRGERKPETAKAEEAQVGELTESSELSFLSDSNTFEISAQPQLSSSSGLSFSVKVPEEYGELLEKGTTSEWSGTSGSSYTVTTTSNYFIFARTNNINDYGNATGTLENSIANEITKTEDYPSYEILTLSLNIPTNVEESYYYYGAVYQTKEVKKYWHSGSVDVISSTTTMLGYTSNYYQTSIKELAIETLENETDLSESERDWLQEIAGIKPDTEEVSVTLKYKTAADYADIEEQTYTFSVKSTWAQNKTLVLSVLYDLTPYKNIAELNVVYTSDYWQDGYVYKTQERIILQARDFEYTYNEGSQTGTLEVIYNDFQYKDLSLRITNNDPANNLTLDYYTADAVVGETTTTLTYNFADIEEQLHNSCNWLFDFGKENIRITGTAEGVTTKLTDTALIVTFPNSKEKELVNLSLIGVAEIIEDIEYTLTYEYAGLLLSGTEIIETVKTSSPITKMYSEIVTCNFTNFMTDYGEIVNEAINPDFLGGAEYYIPVSIQKEYSAYDARKAYL